MGPILKGFQPNLSKRGSSGWWFSLLTTPVLTSPALLPMAVLCLAPCPSAQQASLLAWPLGPAWPPLPAVLATLLASSHTVGHKQPTRTPCLPSGQPTRVLSGRHTQINHPRGLSLPSCNPLTLGDLFHVIYLPCFVCKPSKFLSHFSCKSQACFSPQQGCLLLEKSDVS